MSERHLSGSARASASLMEKLIAIDAKLDAILTMLAALQVKNPIYPTPGVYPPSQPSWPNYPTSPQWGTTTPPIVNCHQAID